MAYAVGGFAVLYQLNLDYVVTQSGDQSVAMGAVDREWMRQISRLIIWNGTAIVASLWAIPFFLRSRDRLSLLSSQAMFTMVWILPGLFFQALIHVEDPGHTVFSVPALCMVSAYLIFIGSRAFENLRDTLLGAALVINTMLFLGFVGLPDPGGPAGGWHSLKNAILFGTFETSIEEVRYMENTSRLALKEVRQFSPTDRPMVIVTSDDKTVNWFMNWRIARYYAPEVDMWVLHDLLSSPRVQHIRRDRVLETRDGPVPQVPIPRGGRVLWLLEPDGPFQRALKAAHPTLMGGAHISYFDVAREAESFRVMNFEFVPSDVAISGATP
jgi:hypothetical protein